MLVEYIKIKGKRRGVLLAGVDDEKKRVLIGFSLCHSNKDAFDIVEGVKRPGFGVRVAHSRSIKWAEFQDFIISTESTDKFPPDCRTGLVVIPQSIAPRVAKFASRARKYYKQAQVPKWAAIIETQFT